VGLPNLFVIGAAKSGTTSLHAYLARHPQIHMSAVKEPRFFAAEPDQEIASSGRVRHLADYEALFETDRPLRGESSPSYSMSPIYTGVPERIHARVPDARFVYLLRDPVERAIAHYAQSRAAGHDPRPAAVALAAPEEPRHVYVCASRYATQIEGFHRVFGPDRVLVVDQRRLLDDPDETLATVLGFLGADLVSLTASGRLLLNRTAAKREPTETYFRLRRRLPGRTAAVARRLLSRPAAPVVLPPPVRAALERHLRPEADRLRVLTGQAFAGWSV
jgi:hypothetical protein